MLEKDIEKKLRLAIKGIGGQCLKFESPAFTGVPDRIILLPGGIARFAETKKLGDKERARQKLVQDEFRELGFVVYNSVDSTEKINAVVEDCKKVVHNG